MDPIFDPEEIDLKALWMSYKNQPYLPVKPGMVGVPCTDYVDDDLTLPIMAGIAPLVTDILLGD